MKPVIFRALAKVNKVILPSFKDKDLSKLTITDKVIVGWRIWISMNALGT